MFFKITKFCTFFILSRQSDSSNHQITMTRSRSPSPANLPGSRGDVPQPVQAGGVADYRTSKAPEVRYEPVKTGGTADYRPTETASFTKGGGSGNRSSTSSKAKIVPSNRNHLNAKNNSSNSSGNNRRGSSSSNTSSFSCKAKFGAVGLYRKYFQLIRFF